MKKMTLIVMTLILATALCACGGGEAPGVSDAAAPTSAASSSQAAQPTTSAPAQEEVSQEGDEVSVTLTLYADLSGGSAGEGLVSTKDIVLTLEDNPASYAHLVVATLASGLSEWTGLDFTLGEATFDGDSVTVEWSADSTLIAGLDDREQKQEFFMHDAVSLNWFMMDSLMQTLKHNLEVSTVYYCANGGPVTFTNPEDMAAEGLPELPADQPYEGSAFFVSHSDAQG